MELQSMHKLQTAFWTLLLSNWNVSIVGFIILLSLDHLLLDIALLAETRPSSYVRFPHHTLCVLLIFKNKWRPAAKCCAICCGMGFYVFPNCHSSLLFLASTPSFSFSISPSRYLCPQQQWWWPHSKNHSGSPYNRNQFLLGFQDRKFTNLYFMCHPFSAAFIHLLHLYPIHIHIPRLYRFYTEKPERQSVLLNATSRNATILITFLLFPGLYSHLR